MEINKHRGTYAVDGLPSDTTDPTWPIAKTPLSSSSPTPALPKVCRVLVRLQKDQTQLPGEPVTLLPSRSCGSNPGVSGGRGRFEPQRRSQAPQSISGVDGHLPTDLLGAKSEFPLRSSCRQPAQHRTKPELPAGRREEG